MINYTSENLIYESSLQLSSSLIDMYPIYNSSAQKQAATFIYDFLRSHGWEAMIDKYYFADIISEKNVRDPSDYDLFYKEYSGVPKYNVYGIYDSGHSGSTLLLTGHYDIDIIFKDDINRSYVKSTITDNRLYGRGATDMLAGLSVLASINQVLKNWRGRIIFAAVIDEEIGGNGSIRACQYFRKHAIIPDFCIIAEPTQCKVCNESMGFLPFAFTIKSDSVHMNAQKTINPIIKLCDILQLLNQCNSNNYINVNVGYINGGEDPSLPISVLSFRGVCAMRHMTIHDSISLIQRSNIYKDVEIIFPNLRIEPYLNASVPGIVFNSACDAPIFGKNANISTIIWGPGSLEQAHTEDEYIELEQIWQYILHLSEFITVYFENASQGILMLNKFC